MRNCDCSGNCGPSGEAINRREFLGLVSAGAAATLLATPAWGAFELPADELERWKRALLEPAPPRLYLSDQHTDARMHLGGIGTGNFELGADGQLTTWQLFNTLRDGHVPCYFAVKAGGSAKLLQTAGGPDWPRVKQIEMRGEYPGATLRFRDDDLPVQVELAAFSPFAPLDTRLSSMPVAAFIFRLQNPTSQSQTVSLAALMQNPVGYEAAGKNEGIANPSFAGNVNEVLREGRAGGLFMRAAAGREATLDQPVALYTAANLNQLTAPPHDRPDNLTLEVLDHGSLPAEKPAAGSPAVIWLEEAAATTPASFLRAAQKAVQAGGTLVFSGKTMPLLEAYASWTGGKTAAEAVPRADILFEDFEHGYENWKVEGTAFGKQPAAGTLPNQQQVTGFLGKGLVNSYVGGDDSTGRLLSKSFTVERNFIRFLIGGGSSRRTQIRLLVGGKAVRASAAQKDDERLAPAAWDVREFQGQSAQIEIVDRATGGWGHLNVDQIEFSDLPAEKEVITLLEDVLPARFRALNPAKAGGASAAVEFENLTLHPGATESTAPIPGSGSPARTGAKLRLLTRPIGKGKVILVAGAVLDPANAGLSQHRQGAYAFLCGLVGAHYTAGEGQSRKAPGFGTLALATVADNLSVLPGFDDWNIAWKMFQADGRFTSLKDAQPAPPTEINRTINGAVAATVSVPAGGTLEVPFLLAWHYPNKYAQRSQEVALGCHYATQWPDAKAVLREVLADPTWLRERTELFRRTFYDSTLPYWLLDCLSANAAILRHIGIVFRIANGDVYGWEGSNGCCAPTCTHVWGYEQTLARLYPDLERDMRRIDFKHQQRPDGGVNNRTEVPSPPHPSGEHPFVDGHASCVLKAYREALNSPNESFFQEYWPHIHRAVDYLIGRDAASHGGQPAGYLEDDQWNTYDEALHGVTTFISGYYLATLRAGEEWARRMGDAATADRFHGVFEKGQKKLIELCWNGEYFQQHLPGYEKRGGEFGPGCLADQLIGQWWAHQLGLGYILPKEMVVAALRSVFKYNFKTDLTGWKHAPRAFAGARDKGLIICTWPKGGRPRGVMLYSDEVWTGVEYQVAAHLIYEGLVEEGFAIVKAARDRYDGIPRPPIQRNPWNEIECGGHYARAMSSWSLLLALSGFEYDGPRQALRFSPRHTPENFRSFFVGPEGWGSLMQKVDSAAQTVELSVKWGQAPLHTLELRPLPNHQPTRVTAVLAGASVPASLVLRDGRALIQFESGGIRPKAGQDLNVTLT